MQDITRIINVKQSGTDFFVVTIKVKMGLFFITHPLQPQQAVKGQVKTGLGQVPISLLGQEKHLFAEQLAQGCECIETNNPNKD